MSAGSDALTRGDIVAAARGWLGTPYVHQASCKGAGTDCLGLIRGVYRELYGAEPETPPAYTPDWAEATGSETLRDAARRHLAEIPLATAGEGDVLLFRMVATGPAKHAAILTGADTMIHAWSGRAVCETHLGRWWRARAVYAFSFPATV